LLAGCDAFDSSDALLYVFSTHHATPEDGVFPDRGGEDMPRTFENDVGWEVTLLESYITISSLTVVACNGNAYPMDMFWGPCPEDMRERDLDILTVAGRKMPKGHYCELIVGYGPYTTPEIDPDNPETLHNVPASSGVDGTTVFLRGGANSGVEGDDPVEFEFANGRELTVGLDLSELGGPGEPLYISDDEDFPVELTVSKTYDRYLDGVDFTSFDQDDIEDALDDILADTTRVQEGRSVEMFDPDE
jgi:hypothetical protein